ncbi:RNA 3'-terminal phosphate cyclase [Kamptonema cortianum]|nr:RNA 3'-terminal phosphate cyclase [Geitlerinema splendidum]MDK3158692.1 RNA 3'-terminal phosphate cyclase [Kamptonema cortianum]
MASEKILSIDGGQGEGGGQILRTACTLSAVLGIPFEISNIRANRQKPGLKAQHLAAVQAIASICDAHLSGAALDSTYLRFEPTSSIKAGDYFWDIGTAGSATLVFQTVLPALALAAESSSVSIRGGTHNPFAPTVDYLIHVYQPILANLGWDFMIESPMAGYYPSGGGELCAEISPSLPKPFDISAADSVTVQAIVQISNLPDDVAERGARRVKQRLGNIPCEVVHAPSIGIGASVLIYATGPIRAGFSSLGERGKRMELVVDKAVDSYEKWCRTKLVDEHLADQLVVIGALTPGKSSWEVAHSTDHLTTVIHLVQEFGLKAELTRTSTGTVKVTVSG